MLRMYRNAIAVALVGCLVVACGGNESVDDGRGGPGQRCRDGVPWCDTGLSCVGGICVRDDGTTQPDGGLDFLLSDWGVPPEGGQDSGAGSDATSGSDAGDNPCFPCNPGPCEEAHCVANTCVFTRRDEGSPCRDNNECTFEELCDADGACVTDQPPILCEDGTGFCGAKRQCRQTGDDESVCESSHENLGKSCDDGNDCTIYTVCIKGADATGACGFGDTGRYLDLGALCDDADACTQTDRCDGKGTCVGSDLKQGWFTVKSLPELNEGRGPNGWHGWRSLKENPGQSASWVATGRLRRIELSGAADSGGYCYAWWGAGHAVTGTRLGDGQCSVDQKSCLSSVCSQRVSFDNQGNAAVCAEDLIKSHDLPTKVVSVDIAQGTTLHFDLRRRFGKHDHDWFKCRIRLSCE